LKWQVWKDLDFALKVSFAEWTVLFASENPNNTLNVEHLVLLTLKTAGSATA
jgi:hypothetical protein